MATPKQYNHIGACPILIDGQEIGNGPFAANIDPVLESFLISIGSIEPVAQKPAIKPLKPAAAEKE